jgi:hypothetical protein
MLVTPPVPPLPRWVTPLALALGLGLTVAAAALEGAEHPALEVRTLHGLVQVMAGVAFALGGLNEILHGWRRRRWRELTQWIAYDLLNQAMGEARIIAVTVSSLLHQVAAKRIPVAEVDQLFVFPWSPTRALVLRELVDALQVGVQGLFAGARPGSAPDPAGGELRAAVVDRVVAAGPELERRADKLRGLTQELGPYLDEREAIALVTAVAQLHEPVRGLIRLPLRAGKDLPALLAGLLVVEVLAASGTVAGGLGEAYGALRGRLNDQALLAKLVPAERRAADDEARMLDEREADRRQAELFERIDADPEGGAAGLRPSG